MKIKNKIKHSLLTAAILLTVSGGSAYAMPTGGNVTMGNVTNVANPAEIMTANANSIINWDSFSVGVGEKVTFDTQKFMVLNRVRGGQESQILGMLSDQGQGKLLLINPAGIVLGENAVINANELVLSTMSLSDTQFKAIANGNVGVFEGGVGNNEKIEIKSGANLTLNEALRLYGGKITIADGVEIVSKECGNANVDIAAGIREHADLINSAKNTYTAGTDIKIGAAKIGTKNNPISNIFIKGNKTTLDNTEIIVDSDNNDQHNMFIFAPVTNINSSNLLNRSGGIFVVDSREVSDLTFNNDGTIKTIEVKADPDNEIVIANSSISTEKSKDIMILGGNVTLDHSQLNSGKDIFVGAVKTYDSKEGVRTATTYDTSIVKADKDTVVRAKGYAEAYGANLNIQAQRFDNVIDSTNPFVQVLGENGISLDELAFFLKDHPEYEDTIYNILNTRIENKNDVKNTRDDFVNDYDDIINIIKNNLTNNSTVYNDNEKRYIDQEAAKNLLDNDNKRAWLKFAQFLSTMDGKIEGNDELLALGSFAKYMQDFYDCFGSGQVTPDKLTHLAGDSIDLWKKLYDSANKIALSPNSHMYINSPNKYIDSLGILTSFLELTGTVISAQEGFDEKTLSTKIADYLDCAPAVANVFKEAYNFKQKADGISIIKAGPYKPSDIYATVFGAAIDTTAQAIRSHEKYYADGKWDTNDTAETMIDAPLAGLKSITHSMTLGLDDVIFGWVEDVSRGDKEKSGLSYVEQSAEGWKMIARTIGNTIGSWFSKLNAN